jgi:hypothetical protein
MITHERNAAARLAGKILVLLLASGALAGCARRYDMILTNGQELTNVRRPTLSPDHSFYSYVLPNGRTNYISQSRVTLVQPHQKTTFTSPH